MIFDIENNVLTGIRGDETTIEIPQGVVQINRAVFNKSTARNVIFPKSLKYFMCIWKCPMCNIKISRGIVGIGLKSFDFQTMAK